MSKEIGTLVVVVLKARNLPDRHSLYKQDVFAQVTIHDKTNKTAIDVKGGQHPVWDEELRFPILKASSPDARLAEVSCWRREAKTDELIGKGKVDITETLRTGEFDDWVKLEESGLYRGEIYLEMTYFAAGPAPLQRRPSKLPTSERLNRPSKQYVYSNLGAPPINAQKVPSPLNGSPMSASNDPRRHSAVPTAAMGAHLSPGPSPHTSPRTSPRTRYDALPPIPQGPLSPEAIPDILRPGNPKSDIHYTEKPHPPEWPTQSRLSTSPPRSAAGAAFPAASRPVQSSPHAPPPSLRPGPPRERLPATGRPAPNLLSPENPVHARYPASPPRTPPPASAPHPQPTGAVNASIEPPSVQVSPWRGAASGQYPNVPPSENPVYVSYPASPPRTPPPVPALPPHPQPGASFANASPFVQAGPWREARPYPYNYGPPPPEETPPPMFSARYSKPLPLPDEPEGVQTPTPAHPQPYVSSPNRRKPAPTTARGNVKGKSREVEERDELLARRLEEEEEARKREAEERERQDEELAKKLDLELNLSQEEGEWDRDDTAPQLRLDLADGDASLQTKIDGALSPSHMPGSWQV